MCTVLKFVRNAHVSEAGMGKFIIVCLNFSEAGEKFTKTAETVTGGSFIFLGKIYSILKCSVF